MQHRSRRPFLAGLAVAVLVLAADQASKAWVLGGLDLPQRGRLEVLPPVLDLVMVWNHGITFGLLQTGSAAGTLLLSLVALAVTISLLLWLWRADRLPSGLAIGAIAGGAVGNIADRFRHGMVVDFLHVHWGTFDPFPYVFNVGDSAIVLGVAWLLLESALAPRGPRLQDQPPTL